VLNFGELLILTQWMMAFAILLRVGFTQISGELAVDSDKVSSLSSDGDLADTSSISSSTTSLFSIQGWVAIRCNSRVESTNARAVA
jgi:hypothetical protein